MHKTGLAANRGLGEDGGTGDMDDHLTVFGVLLKRFRGRAGLTQEALAHRAGLSIEAVNKLERGERRTPRCDTVAMLACALHLSSEEWDTLERAAQRPPRPHPRGHDRPGVRPATVAALLQGLAELHARQATLLDELAAVGPDALAPANANTSYASTPRSIDA